MIRDAGDLDVAGMSAAIADVAERTCTNKLSPDDLTGGTFTLTNTGSRGALFDTPIINQPQVAILARARSSSARSWCRMISVASRSRSVPWSTSPSPTTTAWSTVPTPPGSSRRSRDAWSPATSTSVCSP